MGAKPKFKNHQLSFMDEQRKKYKSPLNIVLVSYDISCHCSNFCNDTFCEYVCKYYHPKILFHSSHHPKYYLDEGDIEILIKIHFISDSNYNIVKL